MSRKSLLLVLCLAVALVCAWASSALGITMGLMAPGSYAACPLDDRWSAVNYIQYFQAELMKQSGVSTTFRYDNTQAWEDRLLAGIDTVNLFVYSGHGLDSGVYPGGANMHFYARDAAHGGHTSTEHSWDIVNTCWDELRDVGLGPTLKWTFFYTCNHLRTDDDYEKDRMMAMFQGLHLSCGFARAMYIDPNAGTMMAQRMRNGWSIIDAWNETNRYYQEPQATTWTKVVGHQSCASDTMFSWSGSVPSYIRNGMPGATEPQFLEWKFEI